MPGLAQPAAGLAVTTFLVLVRVPQVLDGRLQRVSELLDGRLVQRARSMLVQPVACAAELAFRAFLNESVVVAAVTTIREIDVAFENPARILEQVSDIARDRPGLIGLCSHGETPSLTT